MARIRTIKPEFWSSPDMDGMDPWARLLYIAMWNFADDHGRGSAEPRELMGFAFPREDSMTLDGFRRVLGEVHRGFGVSFYRVGGRPFYAIPTWERHQKIDKRSQPRCPGPDEGVQCDPQSVDLQRNTGLGEDSAKARWEPSSVHRGLGEDSTPEVGSRKKEEGSLDLVVEEMGEREGEESSRDGSALDSAPSSPNGSEVNPTKSKSDSRYADEGFARFWQTYPRNVAKAKAFTAWRSALKRTDAETIIAGAKRYADACIGTESRYIKHPATWLNGDCWDEDDDPNRIHMNRASWVPKINKWGEDVNHPVRQSRSPWAEDMWIEGYGWAD